MAAQSEVIAEGLSFPEGPVIMADGSVIVVEIGGACVSRCWNGRREVVSKLEGGPNGAAVGPDGALYVCNNGGMDFSPSGWVARPDSPGRIERIDLATGKMERVLDRCGDIMLSAPNDLVFAADGTMWFTDFGKIHAHSHDRSALYHCDLARGWIEIVDRFQDGHGATSYNGVGLSPDGSTVYVADTFTARVYAFDAGVRGRQRPRMIATVPGFVSLDSVAMTGSGDICVGTLIEGGISQVSPDGRVTKPYVSDDPYVTNIAFGGADLRDAFLTLSATGKIVKVRWDEPGLRLHFNG